MSGGRWNYNQSTLANDMFDWRLSLNYGERGREQSKVARKLNPMGDRDISEIVWDVLCLIQSRDWNVSGDTCDETYLADVKAFKEKWFKRTNADVLASYKDDLMEYAKELANELQYIPQSD